MKLEIMAKEIKQLKKLSDEDLRQVTGGKEQYPGSHGSCNDPAYKADNPDECGSVFDAKTGDSK